MAFSSPSVANRTQAGSSLSVLLILSHPFLRKLSYEVFLRAHQALAALSAYTIWRHLPFKSLFPRFYIYFATALFLSVSILQCGIILYRNGTFIYGFSRAAVTRMNGDIKIHVKLSRPVKVKPGQYVEL